MIWFVRNLQRSATSSRPDMGWGHLPLDKVLCNPALSNARDRTSTGSLVNILILINTEIRVKSHSLLRSKPSFRLMVSQLFC